MSDIFTVVLNMSVKAAFIITALCLARLLLRKTRAPKWISYTLWAVAGFRLAVPFTIESVLSLLPQGIPEFTTPPIVYPSITSGTVVVPPDAITLQPGSPEWTQLTSSSYVSIPTIKPVWTTFDTLAVIWLVGIAFMLLYSVFSYARLLRSKDSVATPFIYGFIKPRIYIPHGLSEYELHYAMLHEQTHIKRRDYLVKLLAFALLSVHWFNPLAWVAFVLLCADMEMSCDERVLRELGVEAKADYSQALLSLSANRRILNASPLAFGEGGIKERVKNVLSFRKPSRMIIIAALVLVIILSVGFAVNRMHSENESSIDNDLVETDAIFAPTESWKPEVQELPAENKHIEPGTISTPTERWEPEVQEIIMPSVVATGFAPEIRNQLYLGMTKEEVYDLCDETNNDDSGMTWYG